MRVDHVDVEDATEIVERGEATVAPNTITHRTPIGEVCTPAVEMVALVHGAVGESRAMTCADRREIFESAGTVMMLGLSVAGASVVSEPVEGITTHQIIPTERTHALGQAKVPNANNVQVGISQQRQCFDRFVISRPSPDAPILKKRIPPSTNGPVSHRTSRL